MIDLSSTEKLRLFTCVRCENDVICWAPGAFPVRIQEQRLHRSTRRLCRGSEGQVAGENCQVKAEVQKPLRKKKEDFRKIDLKFHKETFFTVCSFIFAIFSWSIIHWISSLNLQSASAEGTNLALQLLASRPAATRGRIPCATVDKAPFWYKGTSKREKSEWKTLVVW